MEDREPTRESSATASQSELSDCNYVISCCSRFSSCRRQAVSSMYKLLARCNLSW